MLLKALATAATLAISLLSVTTSEADAAVTSGPIIVGHAAGKGWAPENTIPGFNKNVADGATMVEADFRWSAGANTSAAPGWPVWMHDETIDRTTNGTGVVSSLSASQLGTYKANAYAPWDTDPIYSDPTNAGYKDPKIPGGWDIFHASYVTGATLLMHVSITPTEWNMKKLLQYADMFPGSRDRMIYMGTAAGIAEAKKWAPDLTYLLIEYPPVGVMRPAEWLVSQGIAGYVVPYSAGVDKAYVDYYHANGIKVYCWTSDFDLNNTEAQNQVIWNNLAVAGVDAIITNQVKSAISWKAKR